MTLDAALEVSSMRTQKLRPAAQRRPPFETHVCASQLLFHKGAAPRRIIGIDVEGTVKECRVGWQGGLRRLPRGGSLMLAAVASKNDGEEA